MAPDIQHPAYGLEPVVGSADPSHTFSVGQIGDDGSWAWWPTSWEDAPRDPSVRPATADEAALMHKVIAQTATARDLQRLRGTLKRLAAAARGASGRRFPLIRYRCPVAWGRPPMGLIVMGEGPRVRRAYRVLGARPARREPRSLDVTWHLSVEYLSAEAGRAEVAAGCPMWTIIWDSRKPKPRTNREA